MLWITIVHPCTLAATTRTAETFFARVSQLKDADTDHQARRYVKNAQINRSHL